jgi:uncharacterized membrane protein
MNTTLMSIGALLINWISNQITDHGFGRYDNLIASILAHLFFFEEVVI